MFLLFSHNLLQEQREEAMVNYGVKEFVSLPSDLQKIWSNIPVEVENIRPVLKSIFSFLNNNFSKGDLIFIQGDAGASYLMVKYSKKNNFIPVYATTKRVSVEKEIDNKIQKKSIFKHIRFRKY